MLEPTTISVPNLAARWNQTTGDILEHAAYLRINLLFNFDGLVFDFSDDWLPFGKDAMERRKLQALTDFSERAEAQFKRRVNGQLSQWESLDDEQAVSLRARLTAKKHEIEALNELFDDRDRKRNQKHFRGALMATPEMVNELIRFGFSKHPTIAYRPEGPFHLCDMRGKRVLDGPIVKLEPEAAQWKERLELVDMAISMAAVKAIEAAAQPQKTAPDKTDSPEPVVTKSASVDRDTDKIDWRNLVRGEAYEQWIKTLAENGTPTLENVAAHLADWCINNKVNGNLGRPPKASYMKTHVIDSKHWAPPRSTSREAAKKHIEQKKQEKQAN